jgi:hypothetical protein
VKSNLKKLKLVKTIAHAFGLSCLASTVFLGLLCFYEINVQKVFIGVEPRLPVLYVETFTMFYAAVYLGYLIFKAVKNM